MDDEDTSISPESFSEENLKRSIYIVTTVVTIDFLILLFGVIGNLITCTVIFFSKSMHTATNFYLFNLAVSDLLLLLTSAPHEIFNNIVPNKVYLGSFGCFFNNWAAETSADVSIMTITAFTIERYLAICHPFYMNSMSQISRVIKIIIFIWIVALISALVLALQFEILNVIDDEYVVCTFEERFTYRAFETMTIVFFVVPMVIITVMYISMGLKLNDMRKELNSNQNFCSINSANERTVKMLVIIVIAFFICWAPFHVQRIIAVIFEVIPFQSTMLVIYTIINDISGALYLLSAAINPIIYSIMSSKFRSAFKERFRKNLHPKRENSVSTKISNPSS